MKKRSVPSNTILAALLLFMVSITGFGDTPYIVQFDDAPQASLQESLAYSNPGKDSRDAVRDILQSFRGGVPEAINAMAAEPVFEHDYRQVFNGVALSLSDEEKAAIEALEGVKAVYPDRNVTAHLTDSVNIVNAPYAWGKYGIEGNGTTVAVIDTGIDYNHPDLGGGFGKGFKVVGGYDFVNKDADPMDDNFHGTHCAGIIAANGTLRGVAPAAKLVALKALDNWGNGWDSDIIAAIEWACDPDGNPATDDKVDIISMSLGYDGGSPDDALSQAVNNAVAKGVVVIVSAGNAGHMGMMTIGSPGCAEKVITVGSSTKTDDISYFSSIGPTVNMGIKPDLLAPGSDIYSTFPGGEYGIKSGTSMAAPHVAGIAALLLEKNPDLTADEIKSSLVNTGIYSRASVLEQGGGRVDVVSAIDSKQFIYPVSHSFRLVNNPLPGGQIVTDKAAFTVKNTTDSMVIYETTAMWQDPPVGFSYDVPYLVKVPANSETTFEMTIQWNQQILQPGYYSGHLNLYNAVGQSLMVPLFFTKKEMNLAVTGGNKAGGYLMDLTIPYRPVSGYGMMTDPAGNRQLLSIADGLTDSDGWNEKKWSIGHYFTPEMEGTHTILANIDDEFGKSTFVEESFTVDLTGPDITLETEVNGTSIQVSVQADENITGTWEALSHTISGDTNDTQASSAAVDANGRLHLFWADIQTGKLKYNYKDQNDSWGTVQLIGDYYGAAPHVMLDDKGVLHLLFWQSQNNTPYYLNYTTIDSASGTILTPPVEFTEIALGDGHVHGHSHMWTNVAQKTVLDGAGKIHLFVNEIYQEMKKYVRIDSAKAAIEEIREDIQGQDVLVDNNNVLHIVGAHDIFSDYHDQFSYTRYDYGAGEISTTTVPFKYSGDFGHFVLNAAIEQDESGNVYVFGCITDFFYDCYRLVGKKFDGTEWTDIAADYSFKEAEIMGFYDTGNTLDLAYNNGKIDIVLEKTIGRDDPAVCFTSYDPGTETFAPFQSLTENRKGQNYCNLQLLQSPSGGKYLVFDTMKDFQNGVSRFVEYVVSPQVTVTGPDNKAALLQLENTGTNLYTGTYETPRNGNYSVTATAYDGLLNKSPKTALVQMQGHPFSVHLDILDWGTGFQGDFTITNHTDLPIENWVLEFDWSREFTFVWDGGSSKAGDHYTISAPSWAPTIPPGGTIKFGVIGNPGNVDDEPKNYTLTGE